MHVSLANTIRCGFEPGFHDTVDSDHGPCPQPEPKPVNLPWGAKFSASGEYFGFLQEEGEETCLAVRGNTEELWINPKVLRADLSLEARELSEEERARQERMRKDARGITEFSLSASGRQVAFAMDGQVFVTSLEQEGSPKLLKTGEGFHNEVRISPDGRHVAYLREQHLYVYDLKEEKEIAFAKGDDPLVSFGRAEFIAAEELDRAEGYWWSPDSKYLAYTRVNLSPIPEIVRPKIGPSTVELVRDRYPFAGGNNAKVQLFVKAREGHQPVELPIPDDHYLARVNWLPDGRRLACQVLNREQTTLTLNVTDVEDGTTQKVLQETNDTWINLHDDFVPFENQDLFLWTSERDGFRQIYLYDYEGNLQRQLTFGERPVRKVEALDEANGAIYFTAGLEDPTEQHLYMVPLDPTKLTREQGFHSVNMSGKTGTALHRFEGPDHKPALFLQKVDSAKRVFEPITNAVSVAGTAEKGKQVANVIFGTLKGPGGDTLHYRLARPKNFDERKIYPVIVDVYGGPHVQLVAKKALGGLSQRLKKLVDAGYVVFSLDNRGSKNRGLKFEGAIKGEFGKVEVEDQVAGVEFLKTLPYIDKERLGVFGWSYGGYMVLKLLSTHPDLFRAGVSVAPVTNWELYDTGYTERYLSKPQDNAEGYKNSSALADLANFPSGKLLLLHGSGDDNVFYSNTVEMKQELENKGVLFEEHTYVGKGHTMNDKRPHVISTTVDFFNRKLRA